MHRRHIVVRLRRLFCAGPSYVTYCVPKRQQNSVIAKSDSGGRDCQRTRFRGARGRARHGRWRKSVLRQRRRRRQPIDFDRCVVCVRRLHTVRSDEQTTQQQLQLVRLTKQLAAFDAFGGHNARHVCLVCTQIITGPYTIAHRSTLSALHYCI